MLTINKELEKNLKVKSIEIKEYLKLNEILK
jgi:hypothetical protein